jgi:ABC-type nitrate/sulfonate/bicarbonate transport system permease component
VVLASCAEYLATGLRLAIVMGFIATVGTELVAGTPGIGLSLANAQAVGAELEVYAYTLLIAVMGFFTTILGTRSSGTRRILVEAWLPIVVLALWWTLSSGSTSFYFPSLENIWSRFNEVWLFDGLAPYLYPSLLNLLIGFHLALAAGVVLGTLLGLVPGLYRACWFVLELTRATPMIVLIPIAIMFLGVGSNQKVALIAFASVWPILLGTADGIREIDPMARDTARAYAIPARVWVTQIMIPAAMPKVLAGTRVSVSVAVSMMVGSELFASTEGIGYFVLRTRETSAVTDLWTAIIVLGLVGYLVNLLQSAVEHYLLRWHRGARAGEART